MEHIGLYTKLHYFSLIVWNMCSNHKHITHKNLWGFTKYHLWDSMHMSAHYKDIICKVSKYMHNPLQKSHKMWLCGVSCVSNSSDNNARCTPH